MGKSKRIAFLGMCTALALILAYVEVLIQPLFPSIPGIKMGLPNIIIIFLLYRRGAISAAGVSLLRIILVSILFGNVMTLSYSLAGGILSLAVMIILRKLNLLSTVGVSVAGGVTHNVGQILMAMLLLETAELCYYLVVLTVTGTIAGILIGLCGSILIKKIPSKLV
ncbi:MAG: Gx transporter family protein [Oscillospiraceae bacterium]|nr:Gx transporter family protein [Oscillospiraceae bacterium]